MRTGQPTRRATHVQRNPCALDNGTDPQGRSVSTDGPQGARNESNEQYDCAARRTFFKTHQDQRRSAASWSAAITISASSEFRSHGGHTRGQPWDASTRKSQIGAHSKISIIQVTCIVQQFYRSLRPSAPPLSSSLPYRGFHASRHRRELGTSGVRTYFSTGSKGSARS
jgi:hypothetical protein